MPLIRASNTFGHGRTRPVSPRCRGGASSLLRLSLPRDRRLPTPADLGDWVSRATGVMLTVTGLHLDTETGGATP